MPGSRDTIYFKPHCTKTGLNIFVFVIPKVSLADTSSEGYFGCDIDIDLYSIFFTDYVLQSGSYQKKALLG